MRAALVGTRGVPAQYGGFETAVEEIGARLVTLGWDVVVYCRNPGQTVTEHRGMRLVNLPALHSKALETLSHTALSTSRLVLRDKPDVAVLFNAANAPFLPLLRAARVPTVVHVDGLEWKRGKWGPTGRRYYRWAERSCARRASAVVADAVGIQDHYRSQYSRDTVFIPYGAPVAPAGRPELLSAQGLAPGGFDLVVARFEPENQVLEAVRGFQSAPRSVPLAVVGSAPYGAAYTAEVRAAAASGPNDVRLLGSVYDQDLLDQLYGSCRAYVHGHTVGGTNPSLLRAMAGGAAVLAHDNVFNREVTGDGALYWADSAVLSRLLLEAESGAAPLPAVGVRMRQRARAYDWDDVAERYARLLLEVAKA